VLREGTLANTHFLGIPATAPNVAGAMVVADFLLSAEAQLEKQKPEVWADGTVLARARLPAAWRARFDSVARAADAIPADTLARYARPRWRPSTASGCSPTGARGCAPAAPPPPADRPACRPAMRRRAPGRARPAPARSSPRRSWPRPCSSASPTPR
jgi:hypothetical protein